MLIEILFTLVSYLIRFLAWLLPNWQLPDFIIDSFIEIINDLYVFNFILPLQEIFQVLYIILIFEVTLLFARAIAGLISLIRGGGEMKI